MSNTYSKRDKGGYYAASDTDRRIVIVRKADSHMITTNYFAWTARGFGKAASGATRDEAVNALRSQLGA